MFLFFSGFLIVSPAFTSRPLSQLKSSDCSSSLEVVFVASDFESSAMTKIVSFKKKEKIPFGKWAASLANEVFLQIKSGQSTESILREMGNERHQLALDNSDQQSDITGKLVFELSPDAAKRKPRVSVGSAPDYGKLTIKPLNIKQVSLTWPEGGDNFDQSHFIARSLFFVQTLGYTEVGKPDPQNWMLNADSPHQLFSSSKEVLRVGNETFRDQLVEIDLCDGTIINYLSDVAEAKRYFHALGPFIDQIRQDPTFELNKIENLKNLLMAEKLFYRANPFARGGATIGRIFWMALWSHLSGGKYKLPTDADLFSLTSSLSVYTEERLNYHRELLRSRSLAQERKNP